jgi:hypothetical protein
MVYSIAVLEQSDFETLGRHMPAGAGINNSVTLTNAAHGQKKGRGPEKPIQ